MAEQDLCVICGDGFTAGEEVTRVTSQGAQALLEISKGKIQPQVGDTVHHAKCRIPLYRNAKSKESNETKVQGQSLQTRSKDTGFDYAKLCLLCGKGDPYNGRKSDYQLMSIREVKSDVSLLTKCETRKDEWGVQVKGRINYANILGDLHSHDANYHLKCRQYFMNDRYIPTIFSGVSKKRGRPKSMSRHDSFFSRY